LRGKTAETNAKASIVLSQGKPAHSTAHRCEGHCAGFRFALSSASYYPADIGGKSKGAMKHYVGERTPQGCEVEVLDQDAPGGGYPLNPRFDLRNHSPTGVEWGYGGSGPAQLALALLADALDDDERAQDAYQDFKFRVVGRLPHDRWELSQEQILQTVAQLEAKRGRRQG
jgi:hypothetical protein